MLENSITIRGHEIKMTLSRLNHVSTAVGSIELISTLAINPVSQERVLRAFLSPLVRKDDVAYYDSDNLIVDYDDLTVDEGMELLDFIQRHLLDFFTRLAEKMKINEETASKNS